jgi:PPOX class probable F420-dependent enzyme
MALTTYRKTGLAVTSPVWFAQVGDVLYFLTEPHAGKMKRIRNNNQVQVAPCTARGKLLGPVADATARELTLPAERKAADDALTAKYGIQKKLFELLWKVQRTSPTFVEVRERA